MSYGYFTGRRTYIYENISLNSSWNEKYFSDKYCRGTQNTFYVQQLFPENRDVFEILWKNVVEPNMPQITK